ncbi:MAG: polysaccharide biosynthesis/export family protein [Pseudomonadota bacterium]
MSILSFLKVLQRSLLAIAAVLTLMVSDVGIAVETANGYRVQAGDSLRILVWREEDLQQEVLVRPDGSISFPLVGDVVAMGRTVDEIREDLATKIEEYIPDPVVTVQVMETIGNRAYVLGKVNRPGPIVMAHPTDVTQALALAGGLATFADENKISILRRTGGSQTAIPFRYGDVQYGRDLDQNIMLEPGDVVVVP